MSLLESYIREFYSNSLNKFRESNWEWARNGSEKLVWDIPCLSYEESQENFDWLYIPFDLLQDACTRCGLKARKVMDGEQMNYLAELKML